MQRAITITIFSARVSLCQVKWLSSDIQMGAYLFHVLGAGYSVYSPMHQTSLSTFTPCQLEGLCFMRVSSTNNRRRTLSSVTWMDGYGTHNVQGYHRLVLL